MVRHFFCVLVCCFSYAAAREEDGILTEEIVKCVLLSGNLEIYVELRIIQLC